MDSLLGYYSEKFASIEGNIFEIFSQFYNLDLSPIDSWLESHFINIIEKDDKTSTHYRKEGNKCYARKDLVKSLKYYTKSVCNATPGNREYALALANRSAVILEMGAYENCLRDIEHCLKADYPNELKPKIHFRKAECYLASNQKEYFEKCVAELDDLLGTNAQIENKDKYVARLNNLKKGKMKNKIPEVSQEHPIELPTFSEGENINFAYASSKIRISYEKSKGRHVIASKKIHKGELLFIEKAFIFAPVFKEDKCFYPFKCYNCLNDVISSIPCKSCTLCIYCSEKCLASSWNECHRWECVGMKGSIWYDLGIAFPAFKAVLKGVKSGFKTIKGDHSEDLKKFGDKQDNYPYFNRLISHIYKTKNAAPYVVMAAVVVTYLKKHTNFFPWFLKQKNCPKSNMVDLVNYTGGLITKHIAQLTTNSSIIEHWTYSSTDLLFPDILVNVACGMFPSVSIMNHSCRPNVTNFFICDTIVVKALDDISENKEIYNCYGIDYRIMNREQRQMACRSLYHFDCKCEICTNPSKEVDVLDSYLCPKCKSLIPDLPDSSLSFCVNCGKEVLLEPLRKTNKNAQKYLEDKNDNQLENLLKCLKLRKEILYKHHKDFEDVYYSLYNFFVGTGDAENMFKYFHFWLQNEKARKGDNSRGVGTKLYEAALAILHCLQNNNPKNCSNLK
ncbi:unnamed protein product [Acanthoscelides obtectus]|nr:unnamed protein product [Acanthoscelides obtectus]CAK1683168.1 SET and MYND domain-containing protein 4 [Acanthoscelides obtectus]